MWSNRLLMNYIHATYVKLTKKEIIDDAEDLSYGYSQKYLQDHRFENITYWKNQIDALEEREDLEVLIKPNLRSEIVLSNYKDVKERKEKNEILDKSKYQKIQMFCNENKCTVEVFFQYCWHKLISLYTNTETTVIGTVSSGRNLPIKNIKKICGIVYKYITHNFRTQKRIGIKSDT